jgi:predicted molibdopterin-dependent oxidoreductase YjgC
MASQELVSLTVDGTAVEALPGTTLLDVLRGLGKRIPTLCHDPRLTPYGGCRLCVVMRRDGRGGLVPSCSTPVLKGMVVESTTPEVIEARRYQLRLLLLNHRLECPVCERHGDCRLQDLMYEYGVPEERFPFDRVLTPRDESSPLITRDNEKCILCGKCVRLCDEVQGVAEIGIINRGLKAHVTTSHGAPLDCEFCGQCVDACPVGALVARPFDTTVPAWMQQSVTTTCGFCSAGCQLSVDTHDDVLTRVTSPLDDEPSHGKLCVKGRFGWDLLGSPDRLTQPLLRRGDDLVPASWDEALDAVVAGIKAARAAGHSIAGLGSARLSNEAAFLFQELLRTGLATPHVGFGVAAGVDALVEGVMPVLGAPRSTATYADLVEAQTVLVVRGDPARTQPLAKTQIVQGINQRGHRLIMAHASTGGLERLAQPFVPVSPGTEDALLLGLTHLVLASRPGAMAAWAGAPGFDAWQHDLAAYTPGAVAAATGVAETTLRELAQALLDSPSVVGVVVTAEGLAGDEAAASRAMVYLLSALGRLHGPASGLLVLGEKGNVQGIVDMGLHPALRPGWRDAGDGGLAPGRGWSCRDVLDHATKGDVGMLWIAGHDPLCAWPRSWRARDAVESAGFVVVQDAFLTETARCADVVLPTAIFLERNGTSVGADGVGRTLTAAMRRPAGAAQDDDILVEIARRLGVRLTAVDQIAHHPDIRASRPPADGPRAFLRLGAPSPAPAGNGISVDLSAQLFHSGSTTLRSRTLCHLAPPTALHLSRADAREAGVGNGEPVHVATEGAEVLVGARVSRTVRPGVAVLSRYGVCSRAAFLNEETAGAGAEIRRSV